MCWVLLRSRFVFVVNRKQCVHISMINGFILAGLLRATDVYRVFFRTHLNGSLQKQLGQILSVGWRSSGCRRWLKKIYISGI